MQKHELVKSYNFFGHAVYSPLAALLDDGGPLREFMQKRLEETLKCFDYDFTSLARAGKNLLDINEQKLIAAGGVGYKRQFVLTAIEDTLREVLRKKVFKTKNSLGRSKASSLRSKQLKERSRKIARQVLSALEEAKKADNRLLSNESLALLDVGCGDGAATAELVEAFKASSILGSMRIDPAVLVDVADYRLEEVRDGGYPFVELPPDYQQFVLAQRVPSLLPQQFDVILLLTVLHHTQVPSSVFRACAEVASNCAVIVVIESCVGIVRSSSTERRLGNGVETNDRMECTEFSALGTDEQLRYAAFVDWLYSRVIQTYDDVYVPCNFATPDEWNRLFREFSGVDLLATYYEGFDQPLVPEFHTIHIVRRSMPGERLGKLL